MGRPVVMRHQVLVTDDPEAAREQFRRRFTSDLGTGVYNRFLAWCGEGDAASELEQARAVGDREGTRRALSDRLVDSIAVLGDVERCRATLTPDRIGL